MTENWSAIVKRYRLRHSLTQADLAAILHVSQRTVSRWERGEDKPGLRQQKKLRDMAWDPSAEFSNRLFASVARCPAPRALSLMPKLTLLTLSQPAIRKRPSITEWIGRDLSQIASGVLAQMLDDRTLQRSIASGEIACVMSTTRSVLRMAEEDRIGAFQTTISYFFHDGRLYSDAFSVPISRDTPEGYRPIPMDAAFDG
ncbi:MAG: helix-turn-helix transcriptional regulator [Rhodomicrobium sp.]|nr:helix-turn-helix transcriptional regulator [Rhodomicrobium sp.]